MNTLAQVDTFPDNVSTHQIDFLQQHQPHKQIRIVDTPGDKFTSEIVAGALQIAGLGRRVLVVQLLKGGIRQGHDRAVNLAQNLDWIRCNLHRKIAQADLDPTESHDFQQLWQHVRTMLATGEYSLAIVDGLSLAIELGSIGIDAATSFLTQLPQDVEVVLTGTNPHPAIVDLTGD
jgi:cob(I)alamin adenosyltransferase